MRFFVTKQCASKYQQNLAITRNLNYLVIFLERRQQDTGYPEMCWQPFFSTETKENTQNKKCFRFYFNLQLTGNVKIEGSLVERNHNMRELPFLRKGRRRENRRIKSMEITEESLDK